MKRDHNPEAWERGYAAGLATSKGSPQELPPEALGVHYYTNWLRGFAWGEAAGKQQQ